MSQDFVIREIDIQKDAERLAHMWQESDDQWPGTWSRGVEITPQMVTEWFERQRLLNVYVAETQDESQIVAYCALNQLAEQENEGYVDLLNVAPAYQGKSLARRMLQRCLERCGELGFRLLTLGTWSGNLKSVPLYKKTGFFWVPDTSVWMLNFIPGILNLPCTQSYFSRHDWYHTFQRELKQVEDDERWNDMKVFTYRWKEDGEALTVWADREAHALTAIETDAFFAGAIADSIEPAKGMSTTLRWKLANKGDRPLQVSLIAAGTQHIKLDRRATLSIAPGDTAEITADVELAPDTPDARRNKPVPAIHSILIIDGEVLELGTGLRPRPAIEISTEPNYVTLFPGTSKTILLQLRSYLQQNVEATVSLAPAPGLSADWTQNEIMVPAKSFAAIPLTLTAAQGGVYPLYATAYPKFSSNVPPLAHKALAERLVTFSLPPGAVLADVADKSTDNQGSAGPQVRIENEWTRLILRGLGGEMIIRTPHDDVVLGRFQERVGPPFWPSELEDKEYRIVLDEKDGRFVAALTADLETHPGTTLCRQVTMGGGPLIEIEHTVANTGSQAHEFQIDRHTHLGQRERATITLPLDGGIVQSRATEFPDAEEDVPKTKASFRERWAATTSEAGTLGLIWEDSVVENEFAWGVHLRTPTLNCPPHTWTPAGRLLIYAGPGDWRTVRRHAQRMAGMEGEPEPIRSEARKVHGLRLEPAPLTTVDDEVQATLVVDNLRSRALQGRAELILPAPLSAWPTSFPLSGITSVSPFERAVSLTFPPGPMAYEGLATLETGLFDERIPLPVIRLGSRQSVHVVKTEVTGREVYNIDNGLVRHSLAPGFTGALTRWEQDGINHLLSPFPDQETFGWMSPWYGGITPIVMREGGWDLPGKLYQETLETAIVEQPDDGGIPWRGVRVRAEIAREQLVGLAVEFDYLTVGGSNVLKLVCRVRNRTSAMRRVVIGWLTYWQLDGASVGNTLRSHDIERKHTPWESWPEAGYWGSLTNPETDRTAILVSPHPEVKLIDWGDVGGHLAFFDRVDVQPASADSDNPTLRTCYIALCDSWSQAHVYASLARQV